MFIISITAALAADATVNPADDVASITSSLTPGDTILFEPGTYDIEAPLVWSGVGTEAEPITLKPVEEGAEVIIRNTGYGYGIEVRESAWIIVEGLTVTGDELVEENGYSGILVADSTDVVIRNNTVDGVWGTGLRVDGDTSRITLEGNEVANLGNGTGINIGCGDASCWMQDSLVVGNLVHDVAYTGISLSPGTQNNEFRDNVVFRTGDSGFYIGPTENGPQNIVEANAVWQTGGVGLYVEGSALIRNNVVFETGDDGIYTNNNDRNGLYDTVISHNTFARTEGYGAYLDDFYEGSGLVFANNAVANPTGYGLYWPDEFEDLGVPPDAFLSNNVIAGLVEGYAQLDYPGFVIPGGGYADFVDADNFDFYPDGGSTLINAGDPAGDAYIPELDFNGSTRQGDAPDAGAYEYIGSGNPGWVIQEAFKETGPGAGSARFDVGGGCCGGKDDQGGTEALFFLPLLGFGLGLRRRQRRD
jgi:parallel beta-helix repeat protein